MWGRRAFFRDGSGVFRFASGGLKAKKRARREAGRPRAEPAWDSVWDDFHIGGGDLAQGGVDMVGFDGERVLAGGGEPGGLGQEAKGSRVAFAGFGQQIDSGGSEDVAVESGAGDVPVEVRGDVFAGQRSQGSGGTDATEQGALDAEAQAAQQVVVAQHDEGKGTAVSAAQAEEEAKFFEGRAGVVLGVVKDEHEGDGFEVGEVFFQQEQVGGAFEPGAFAEFGQEDFEDAGGGQRGLGDEERQEPFGFEPGEPGLEQRAFACAGAAGQHHDAAQGGGGVQKTKGFAVGGAGKEFVCFVVGSKGRAAQPPGAQQIVEGGGFGQTGGGFSAHSWFPGGGD